MASTTAFLSPSLPFHGGRKTQFRNLNKFTIFGVGERQRGMRNIAKAVGENPESSSSLSIMKSVQSSWDKPEDRIALAGLGFAAIAALWTGSNLIGAIDKLPLIPSLLEFIGILFSWWFIYRYLLFKPDREELSKIIKNKISDILGQ